MSINFKNFGKVKCEKCGEHVGIFSINTVTVGNNRSYNLCDLCTKEFEAWIHTPICKVPMIVIGNQNEGNYIPTEIK